MMTLNPAAPNMAYPFMAPQPVAGDPMLIPLLNQLGTQTQIGPNGVVRFNEPLIAQIVSFRERAIPELARFFATTNNTQALIEGLRAAEQLAESGVQNAASLYPALSRWNTSPDPLVQIYLAGVYRHLNTPVTFGPMLATLVNRAATQYPLQSSPAYNITEEVGGTLLKQIADTTAEATVQRLLPYLPQASVSVPVARPY